MERRALGRTGLSLPRLCFGTLPLGPLQTGLPPEEGGALLAYAMDRGVDAVDTAELYGTYAHVREAARIAGGWPTVVTKTYAYDREGARASLEKARRELGVDVVDVFLLHEQETPLTLLGHREAYEFLLESKAKGLVRAVGFSTHAAATVEAAAHARGAAGGPGAGGSGDAAGSDPWEGLGCGPYAEVDVVHPILNRAGLGLIDGPPERMLRAAAAARAAGIGILGMKAFGGGHLLPTLREEAAWALALPFADAFAVGMQTRDEVDVDVALFEGRPVPAAAAAAAAAREKRLLVHDWCTGCAACVERCTRGALAMGPDGRAVVDPAKCVLCGYCAAACRDFAIKVV